MKSKCIVVAGLLTLLATSARATFTLTVSTLGPVSSAVVVSSPAGISCPGTCAAAFVANSTVTLTETPASTATFVGWSAPVDCSNNFRTCKVLMSGNKSVSARFNPTLSVSLFGNGGGVVTDSSGSINCGITGSCAKGGAIKQSYFPGSVVVLAASATANSTFYGWSGGGCSGISTCAVTMNGSKVVIATFTSSGPFLIKVSTGGSGVGVITSSPSGINCGSTHTICTASFADNTTITLTATAFSSSTFKGWSNAGCASTGTCVITSSSAQQSTGGSQSPSAFFYKF